MISSIRSTNPCTSVSINFVLTSRQVWYRAPGKAVQFLFVGTPSLLNGVFIIRKWITAFCIGPSYRSWLQDEWPRVCKVIKIIIRGGNLWDRGRVEPPPSSNSLQNEGQTVGSFLPRSIISLLIIHDSLAFCVYVSCVCVCFVCLVPVYVMCLSAFKLIPAPPREQASTFVGQIGCVAIKAMSQVKCIFSEQSDY